MRRVALLHLLSRLALTASAAPAASGVVGVAVLKQPRVGSTWVKNPIPRNDGFTGAGFAPKCDEVPDCRTTAVESDCLCSGMWGPYNLEIVDYVTLPSSLAPGKYVLGWRWDCEESNQVWASCSDVQITAARASK